MVACMVRKRRIQYPGAFYLVMNRKGVSSSADMHGHLETVDG